ncbi:MAG: hypothetical protein Q4G24_08945 [Paracoccus sp. (in: a-proteobacteria)]|uniref:hypothetical protein n=1 Tax=Paracoccus sp. TaxID=267 RepID=UPI0026DEDB4D|nr:hypothetical protein [Paracoccus sp. (in: a-proteobacteria)]MDO5621581.1 hypothetical protein [Paracoccus sp. (in: a-proteobacteria)]
MTAFRSLTAVALILLAPPALADSTKRAASVAQALIPVYQHIGAEYDPAAAEIELARMIDAWAGQPKVQQRLPAAIEQSARLMMDGAYGATRGMNYDLLRDLIYTLAAESGAAETSRLVTAWNEVDPFHYVLQPGTGLAASDLEAYSRLKARVGKPSDPQQLIAYWDSQEGNDVNRVLPTRMAAWVEGVEANWDQLSEAERIRAADLIEIDAMPPKSLVRKVTGTDSMVKWIAAVDVKLTKSEQPASPDLRHFTRNGAFAGPMYKPLAEVIALSNQRRASAGAGAAANQLMRLNNWSAMTGEMHSWESYRYMTQGY